jgi:MerR family transcriptional regulator, light-induced transcriptional regulator
MMARTLESRPLYSIGTVSRLTGIKADTLRVWERRYGLGASSKSPGGRREYTQSDVEHLQIIAALLEQGTRIGDIAKRERKTLEAMFQGASRRGHKQLPQVKPRALFVGEGLAQWLDGHQGCIAQISAFIARQPFQQLIAEPGEGLGEFDAIIVEIDTLDSKTLVLLDHMQTTTGAGKIIICHGDNAGKQVWINELEQRGMDLLNMPPQPVDLGQKINQCIIEKTRRLGDTNTGELVKAKPRQYSNKQLENIRTEINDDHYVSPSQISPLIVALNELEQFSSNCAVDNWQDAATKACIYAYTNQARWLMEKAMAAVLEDSNTQV